MSSENCNPENQADNGENSKEDTLVPRQYAPWDYCENPNTNNSLLRNIITAPDLFIAENRNDRNMYHLILKAIKFYPESVTVKQNGRSITFECKQAERYVDGCWMSSVVVRQIVVPNSVNLKFLETRISNDYTLSVIGGIIPRARRSVPITVNVRPVAQQPQYPRNVVREPRMYDLQTSQRLMEAAYKSMAAPGYSYWSMYPDTCVDMLSRLQMQYGCKPTPRARPQGQRQAPRQNQSQDYSQGYLQGHQQDQARGYPQSQSQEYSQAYSQDYHQNLSQGYSCAYSQGQTQDYPQDGSRSYPQGHSQVRPEDHSQGCPQGYPVYSDGYPQAQAQACQREYSQGYQQSHTQGGSQGSSQGRSQGNLQGYSQGRSQGYPQSVPQQYLQGWSEGYFHVNPQDYPQTRRQPPPPTQQKVPVGNGNPPGMRSERLSPLRELSPADSYEMLSAPSEEDDVETDYCSKNGGD